MNIILLFCFALVMGALGAGSIARLGSKFGFLDKPSSRSSHTNTTPKGGGVGILFSFLAISIYLEQPWSYWVPVLAVAILSLFGDRIDIDPKVRLLIQIIAAAVFLFKIEWLSPYQNLFIFPEVVNHFGQLMIFAVLLFFVVGTANFYNFMDGINGIAGITAIIAFSLLGVVAYSKQLWDLMLLAYSIALSCLGFLPFNIPQAKVFIGDVGAIFLGFAFACFVIILSENFTDLACHTGFLALFYFDE